MHVLSSNSSTFTTCDMMKIEANPTPEQLKFLLLALLIAAGLGHNELMLMAGL